MLAWLHNSTNAILPIVIICHVVINTADRFVLPEFANKNYQVVWSFMVGLYALGAAIVTLVARPKRRRAAPRRRGSSDRADDAEDRAEKRADSERAEGFNGARKIGDAARAMPMRSGCMAEFRGFPAAAVDMRHGSLCWSQPSFC